MEFRLPLINRDVGGSEAPIDHGSGALLVTSENYLLMQPSEAHSQGLLPIPFSEELLPFNPPTGRTPLVYRFQSQQEPAVWVGKASFLPQQVMLEQQAEIEVQSSQIQIDQQFNLRIANRSINQLQLLVREDALPLAAEVGDYLLPYEEVPVAPSAEADAAQPAWRQIRLIGLPDLLGEVRLSVQTAIGWSSGTGSTAPPSSTVSGQSSAVPTDVPLVQLLLDSSSRTRSGSWQLRPNPNFEVKWLGGEQDGSTDLSRVPRPLELKPAQTSLKLAIQPRDATRDVQISTDGLWLQTLLAGNERRDRFVARVRGQASRLAIQLPELAQLDKVALDGIQLEMSAAPYDYNSNRVTVTLPDDQPHVVEVVYLLTEPLTWLHRFKLMPAYVVDADAQDRFYWQLVTPGTYHLGWSPADLTAEWHGDVRLSGLAASVTRTRPAWNGCLARPRWLTARERNSYVMSGQGSLPAVEVWLLSRFILWLPMGILAVVLTLLLLNLPALRTPNYLLVLAAILVGLAMIWPDMSLLVGQTAIVSLALVALMWLTQSAVNSRVRRRSVFSSRPSSIVDGGDHSRALDPRERTVERDFADPVDPPG